MSHSINSAAIPISVIVTTKNEEVRIEACLKALVGAFDEVLVVDSCSSDATQEIARARGAMVQNYTWDGRYPKKRQWCLDALELKHDFVFFVDADEVVPLGLIDEIAALNLTSGTVAGYFVRGSYVFEGRKLLHGLCNNKLALFDRRKIGFPVVDDLNIDGMGEIEGHYQPVLKAGFEGDTLKQLKVPLIHEAYGDGDAWEARHLRYASWEAGMNARGAWPKDPDLARQMLKQFFRNMPFRGAAAFVHSYIFKFGFLDGPQGYRFARSRGRYYRMISDASKAMGRSF